MPITRRSLLQSLGALPATWYLRAFAATDKTQVCTTNPPAPKSAFVLLEGPWLIFPNPNDSAKLRALSLPASLAGDSCTTHSCFFQTWNCGTSKPRPFGDLDPNNPITVTSNSSAGKFHDVFDAAFQQCPFIWASTDSSAHTKGNERYLDLQIPTQIHIAGLLTDSNISGTGYKQPKQNQKVLPHVVTILQYDPPAPGTDVTLTITNHTSAELGPADQLVFSMYHWAPKGDQDSVHMNHAAAFLTSYFSGDGKGIQVTYNSAKYDDGDSDGFSDEELGLQQPTFIKAKNRQPSRPSILGRDCPKSGDYSNCCGGSIVGGGG